MTAPFAFASMTGGLVGGPQTMTLVGMTYPAMSTTRTTAAKAAANECRRKGRPIMMCHSQRNPSLRRRRQLLEKRLRIFRLFTSDPVFDRTDREVRPRDSRMKPLILHEKLDACVAQN